MESRHRGGNITTAPPRELSLHPGWGTSRKTSYNEYGEEGEDDDGGVGRWLGCCC